MGKPGLHQTAVREENRRLDQKLLQKSVSAAA